MTNRLTCTDCGHPIRNGVAFRRSIRFRQVAYHPGCWAKLTSILVPMPRFAQPVAHVIARAREAARR